MKLSKSKLYARWTVNSCIRNNTSLEKLHSTMVEQDFKITDKEMRKLMLEIEKNLETQIECIIGLENGGKISFPYTKIKMNKKGVLEIIKKAFFGELGVSWDIPQKKYNELLKL